MRIAYDLDDTLIPCGRRFPVAAPCRPRLARLLRAEPLRDGMPARLRRLRQSGHEVWVYTSSFRSALWIRLTFWCHGVWLDGVVNQQRHDRALGERARRHAKLPPAFGIDVLFDDSLAVVEEGRLHGFAVVHVTDGASLAAWD